MSRTQVQPRHFFPLAGFVLVTVVIGYGVVIPGTCVAGVNELSLGFASAIAGACITYWMGLRSLVRDRSRSHEA